MTRATENGLKPPFQIFFSRQKHRALVYFASSVVVTCNTQTILHQRSCLPVSPHTHSMNKYLSRNVCLLLLMARPILAQQSCDAEQAAFQACSAQVVIPDQYQDQDTPIPTELILEPCASENSDLAACQEENWEVQPGDGGIGPVCFGFWFTWYFACVPLFPFSCLLNCDSYPDENCDDFSDKLCGRYDCCQGCRDFLEPYVECVENRGVCPVEAYPPEECDKELGFWAKFGIGLGSILGAIGLIALAVWGFLMYRKKKENESKQEANGTGAIDNDLPAIPATVPDKVEDPAGE